MPYPKTWRDIQFKTHLISPSPPRSRHPSSLPAPSTAIHQWISRDNRNRKPWFLAPKYWGSSIEHPPNRWWSKSPSDFRWFGEIPISHREIHVKSILVGGAITILKILYSQWEGLSHILWKIKNVLNHQPASNLQRLSETQFETFISSKNQWLWSPEQLTGHPWPTIVVGIARI